MGREEGACLVLNGEYLGFFEGRAGYEWGMREDLGWWMEQRR